MRKAIELLLGISGATGLGLLAVNSADRPEPADPPSGRSSANTLENQPAWKQLAATWQEAGQVASGQRGDFPFTEEGKKKLLAALEAVPGQLDKLVQAGFITQSEAELLKMDLPRLDNGVQRYRTKGMEMALCYSPAVMPPPTAHADLARRLPLLEKIATQKVLHPQVVARVLQSAEAEIKQLNDPGYLNTYRTPEERQKAIAIRDQAQKDVEKVREALKETSSSFDQTPQWKSIQQTWKEAQPLATTHESTNAQREAIDKKLTSATAAAKELAGKGLLSAAEADLLASEAESLRHEIFREPPTDSMVTCYDRAPLIPAQLSLDRLGKRLPLLRQVAESGTVHPAAIEKIIPTVQDDLRTLGDEKELKLLHGKDLAKARRLHKDATRELQQIRKLLEKKPS